MKRFLFKALVLSFAVCVLFSSCALIDMLTYWEGISQDESFDASKFYMYEVGQDVQFLNLYVDGPVDIYMAKMNPSETAIPSYRTRYIVPAENLSCFSQNANPQMALSQNGMYRKDFKPAQNFEMPKLNSFSSNRSVLDNTEISSSQKAVQQIKPAVDSTYKDIWVDDGTEESASYSQKRATLRAVGETCYVWVIDGFYKTTSSSSYQQKINSSQAQSIADKFDEIYDYVRYIFGEESDYIVDCRERYGQYEEYFPLLTDVSDTGEKVNIVIYDIFSDYRNSAEGGVYGYFWSKDYFSRGYADLLNSSTEESQSAGAITYSNEGKYFYVDSYFVNTDINGIYSTLAHEFQHMINFGTKVMDPARKGQVISEYNTWYTEMLSMLCEDMMQSYLGIPDDKSPLARLPYFCAYYPLSGIVDWLDGTDALVSYANTYTFGAFLARNFGGPELVKEIAQNSYVDRNSITRALKNMGYNETFDSVFQKFIRALVFDNPNEPTLNQLVKLKNSYNAYYYPMKAIDIFNVEWSLPDTGKMKGPGLLYSDSQGNVELRPYGFTLHAIGYTKDASYINLEFSRSYSTKEKDYLMIQPCKHDHDE
ncbi:MAG: hypothetical protein IKZ04_01690 [Spirochaetaceae bacterium]|nr:hypothetical protein [Spirochaetaceae bacterium]